MRNKREKKSITNKNKAPLIFSICLTIVFFAIVLTLIFWGYGMLISNPSTAQQNHALGLFVCASILTIPFGILLHLSIQEAKQIIKAKKNIKTTNKSNKKEAN